MSKKIMQYYVSSQVHVAFSLWAFCQVTALQQGSRLSFSLQLSILSFGWAAYWYANALVPSLYKHKRLRTRHVFLILLGLAIGTYGLLDQPLFIWLVFLLLGILSFCYALPFGRSLGLRFVPGIKIYVISICWTVFASIGLFVSLGEILPFVLLKSMLWMVLLTLPFDVRDMDKDPKRLKTIPQLLGLRKTKILGYFLMLIIAGLVYKIVPVQNLQYAEYAVLGIMFFVFQKVNPKNATYFASFWVEGIPIMWFGLSVFSLVFY
jgi:hypothetical protein